MFHRPNSQRIRDLLEQLEECKQELWTATSKDRADCARSDIAELQRTPWLAGYQPEEEV